MPIEICERTVVCQFKDSKGVESEKMFTGFTVENITKEVNEYMKENNLQILLP